MNLNYLKTFEIVANTCSFAKAAEILYISQPAVSQQIKSLENELGFTLFERSPHSVQITSAGKRFLEGVVDMLRIYEDTLYACQAGNFGEIILRIYYVGYMNCYMPETLSAFKMEFPFCCVEMKKLPPSDASERLRNGDKGLFFVPECILPYHKKLQTKRIFVDRHYVVMRKQNPLNNGREVQMEELIGQEICLASPKYRPKHMDSTIRKIQQLPGEVKITEALGVDNTLPILLATDAVAIMPGYTVPYHPDIIAEPLADEETIQVVIAHIGEQSVTEKALINAALKHAQNIQKTKYAGYHSKSGNS